MEGIAALHPAAHDWHSNRLDAADARPEVVEELSWRFAVTVKDRNNRPAGPPLRMIEKTPKNSLRISFFEAAYPDATFVYLRRGARETLSSMIEAWQSGAFRTYPRLPGWSGLPWSLLLVPGWSELMDLPLPQIVARQWLATTRTLLDDLARLPPERVRAVDYDAFIDSPQAAVARLCGSLGLEWDRPLGKQLPHSRTTVSPPRAGKWRKHEAEIAEVWPLVAESDALSRAFAADRAC